MSANIGVENTFVSENITKFRNVAKFDKICLADNDSAIVSLIVTLQNGTSLQYFILRSRVL